MNKITLSGTVFGQPMFLYKIYGEKFFGFVIHCSRKSGTVDSLPCVVPETLINEVHEKEKIKVFGEVRTWNSEVNGKKRLFVRVFVKSVGEYSGIDENVVELDGYLCKKGIYRVTTTGREVADFIIASHRERNKKTDYIPVLSWGRNALRTSGYDIGKNLSLQGRLQSRIYSKQVQDQLYEFRTTYEISARTIEVIGGEENE